MYKQDVLKNGLKVITSNMPHMESVSIGLWIGVGSRYEEKKISGISHLMEHMLFKGTLSRSATALKESIEGIGGSFNGFTSEIVTCYLVKLPAVHMELGLDVLSDMVLNPKLDSAELEKEKFVICEEIKMYMDQPAHHVFDVLAETMWPNHALGRPIAGYIESVKSFERTDLVNFKNRFYRNANMAVVASGKMDRIKCLKFAKNVFSQPEKAKKFAYEPLKKVHKGTRLTFFHKNTKQTHIAFGFHSIKRDHRLRYAASLLNIILGGNMSSRLFERLREKKALCYDISSSVRKYKDAGAFTIHAGIDNSKFLHASEEVINELKDVKENRVTKDELYRAKEYLKGQLLLALEDTSSRMLWLGEKIVSEGKAPAVKEILRNVEKVSVEEIKEAANIIFQKRKLNLATVGPISKNEKNKIRKILTL